MTFCFFRSTMVYRFLPPSKHGSFVFGLRKKGKVNNQKLQPFMILGECWPEKKTMIGLVGSKHMRSFETCPSITKFVSGIIVYIDIWCSSLFAESVCVCVLGVDTKR